MTDLTSVHQVFVLRAVGGIARGQGAPQTRPSCVTGSQPVDTGPLPIPELFWCRSLHSNRSVSGVMEVKTDVPLLLRLGGIGLLIVGTLVSLVLGAVLLESRDVREWPTVDARVIRSEIEVSKKMVPLGRSRRTHIDFFALRIEYEYEVNGERFTGHRMSLASNPCGYDRAEIEQWTRKCPLGATIPVHYSPAHPERSVVCAHGRSRAVWPGSWNPGDPGWTGNAPHRETHAADR